MNIIFDYKKLIILYEYNNYLTKNNIVPNYSCTVLVQGKRNVRILSLSENWY